MDPKPFSQYFGTNFTPSDVELAQIQHIIKEPTAKIASIREEITETLSRLNELRKTEASLETSIRDYRILISPFRRLPDDILRSIFIACLILREDRFPTMSNKEAPMLLTKVSRRWREIAHSTPRLWASLHIPIPPIVDDSLRPTLATQNKRSAKITALRAKAVDTWLKRSGICMLSISLYDQEETMGDILNTTSLFKVLLPHSHRLKRLSITTSPRILASLKDDLQVKFPVLKTLDIIMSRFSQFYSRQPPAEHQYNDFKLFNAPNVKQLCLVGLPGGFSTFQVITNTDWSSLVTLSLKDTAMEGRNISTLEIQNALRQCISLRKLALRLAASPTTFPGIPQALATNGLASAVTAYISLPALTDLVLHDSSSQSDLLLPTLIAPSLVNLKYSSTIRSYNHVEPSALLSFLQMSSCSLKRLSISNDFTDDDLTICLGLCPELKSLTINLQHVVRFSAHSQPQIRAEDFLNFFTSPTSTSGFLSSTVGVCAGSDGLYRVLCPKLEEVDFLVQGFALTEQAVLNFVSRKQAGNTMHPSIAKLKSVNLRLPGKEEIDFLTVFRQEIEDGLKLDIQHLKPLVTGIYSLSIGQPAM